MNSSIEPTQHEFIWISVDHNKRLPLPKVIWSGGKFLVLLKLNWNETIDRTKMYMDDLFYFFLTSITNRHSFRISQWPSTSVQSLTSILRFFDCFVLESMDSDRRQDDASKCHAVLPALNIDFSLYRAKCDHQQQIHIDEEVRAIEEEQMDALNQWCGECESVFQLLYSVLSLGSVRPLQLINQHKDSFVPSHRFAFTAQLLIVKSFHIRWGVMRCCRGAMHSFDSQILMTGCWADLKE